MTKQTWMSVPAGAFGRDSAVVRPGRDGADVRPGSALAGARLRGIALTGIPAPRGEFLVQTHVPTLGFHSSSRPPS